MAVGIPAINYSIRNYASLDLDSYSSSTLSHALRNIILVNFLLLFVTLTWVISYAKMQDVIRCPWNGSDHVYKEIFYITRHFSEVWEYPGITIWSSEPPLILFRPLIISNMLQVWEYFWICSWILTVSYLLSQITWLGIIVKILCHRENRNILKVVRLNQIIIFQAATNVRYFRKSCI